MWMGRQSVEGLRKDYGPLKKENSAQTVISNFNFPLWFIMISSVNSSKLKSQPPTTFSSVSLENSYKISAKIKESSVMSLQVICLLELLLRLHIP